VIRLKRGRVSRIGLRLFAFNLLVLFVPVLGVLYLDVYETRLLQAQERAMGHQALLLASAIADTPALDGAAVERMFARFGRRGDARLRVYDAAGTLVADSARASDLNPPPDPGASEYRPSDPGTRQRVLYRLGAWIAAMRARVSAALRPSPDRGDVQPAKPDDADPELEAALSGRYGAATRPTPGQRSLTLHVAEPVRHAGAVIGAVVVSQSTFRILQAIYDVRLRLIQIVLASVLAAAALTTLAAMTIVKPLRRLRRTAAALADRRQVRPGTFPGNDRRDELGDLARALEELTRRLDDHIALLEAFAADVSHEFKNPLASIRTAAELIDGSDSVEERRKFVQLMTKDVDRLERLVTGVRELARVDGQIEHEETEPVAVRDLLREIASGIQGAHPAITVNVAPGGDGLIVMGSKARLAQVFENVLSNAASFAPEGSAIDVSVTAAGRGAVVTIADRGPGLPDAHLARVFERFFTYRPDFAKASSGRPGSKPGSARREHVGLGLAIAKRIVEGYGGAIAARNRAGGGAEFEIQLPIAVAR
jgi:two-component system sensor histidine kinase ChvG